MTGLVCQPQIIPRSGFVIPLVKLEALHEMALSFP